MTEPLPLFAGWRESFIAHDPVTLRTVELARRVARTETTVLLHGESGTGKEVLARIIHDASSRANGTFAAINCAAIPEQMLEAMLFGYEKGSFTGATNTHAGKFEQAQGGTLLLDEISEMALNMQAKLLRVLQEREIERLGGHYTIALDVRILATTNRDLREEVVAGRFREDLYYRLNVFPLQLPPLRERPGDILPLCKSLLARHCNGQRAIPELDNDAEELLLQHSWPGNVRELDNVLQRALIMMSGTRLSAADLSFEGDFAVVSDAGDELSSALAEREQQMILDTLRQENGNRQAAARRLGISPRTLRYKLARIRDAGYKIPGRWETSCV